MTVHPDKQYVAFLAEGRFMLPRERTSGVYHFYPRVADPLTGSTDLEWVPASGDGTVYSTSVMAGRKPEDSYNVALIDLAEGPRMMSRVEGVAPEEVRIGMRVKARVVKTDEGGGLVVFDPV